MFADALSMKRTIIQEIQKDNFLDFICADRYNIKNKDEEAISYAGI